MSLNGFPKLVLPGVQLRTLSDLIRHINDLCLKVPDLGFVIIAGRKGDLNNMACMSNVEREQKIAMLTKTRDSLATGSEVPAMPGQPLI